MKLAEIGVELVDSMGNDLSIVNAARVSMAKESGWEYHKEPRSGEEPDTGWQDGLIDGRSHDGDTYWFRLPEKDEKLIKYLATHNHWTPFSHAFLSFRVKVPIFVARQLAKHQVGLTINEESRRYIDEEPEFWVPNQFHSRPDNVKQGSGEDVVPLIHLSNLNTVAPPKDVVSHFTDASLSVYKMLLDGGVAPEEARMVLPQNTMTNFIWSGSLYAFARICNLRLDPHAQRATREAAKQIDEQVSHLFPVSWKYLVKKNDTKAPTPNTQTRAEQKEKGTHEQSN